jgi:hypothetical protein
MREAIVSTPSDDDGHGHRQIAGNWAVADGWLMLHGLCWGSENKESVDVIEGVHKDPLTFASLDSSLSTESKKGDGRFKSEYTETCGEFRSPQLPAYPYL